MIYLIRLVADVARCRCSAGYDKAFSGPAVATAEHGHFAVFTKGIDKILHMRSLARAADSKIAHAYHGNIEFFLSEDLPVEKLVSHIGNASVYFRTRKQHQFCCKRAFSHMRGGSFLSVSEFLRVPYEPAPGSWCGGASQCRERGWRRHRVRRRDLSWLPNRHS